MKGREGNGFKRSYVLVNHLTNQNVNRGATSGHGVPRAEAERLAHEAQQDARNGRRNPNSTEDDEGTEGTGGVDGIMGTEGEESNKNNTPAAMMTQAPAAVGEGLNDVFMGSDDAASSSIAINDHAGIAPINFGLPNTVYDPTTTAFWVDNENFDLNQSALASFRMAVDPQDWMFEPSSFEAGNELQFNFDGGTDTYEDNVFEKDHLEGW